MTLAIIDTGCANLSSVAFAFSRLGKPAFVTSNKAEIKSADHVILPGVGAAPYAMKNIRDRDLENTLKSLTQPLMGICLGMQLLYEELDEGGTITQGLGLIPGRVERLDTKDQPSPHMGWNTLEWESDHPLLAGLDSQAYAYFVHSFAAQTGPETVAYSTHGSSFSAIIQKNNVLGCQFHPERSSQTGSLILENFLKIRL